MSEQSNLAVSTCIRPTQPSTPSPRSQSAKNLRDLLRLSSGSNSGSTTGNSIIIRNLVFEPREEYLSIQKRITELSQNVSLLTQQTEVLANDTLATILIRLTQLESRDIGSLREIIDNLAKRVVDAENKLKAERGLKARVTMLESSATAMEESDEQLRDRFLQLQNESKCEHTRQFNLITKKTHKCKKACKGLDERYARVCEEMATQIHQIQQALETNITSCTNAFSAMNARHDKAVADLQRCDSDLGKCFVSTLDVHNVHKQHIRLLQTRLKTVELRLGIEVDIASPTFMSPDISPRDSLCKESVQ